MSRLPRGEAAGQAPGPPAQAPPAQPGAAAGPRGRLAGLAARLNWRGLAAWALVAALVLAFYALLGCPIRLVTGVPCPGCGMSRALWALLRLDFAAAAAWHPLVFTLPLFAWLVFGRLPRRWGRGRALALGALAGAFVVVWALRLFVFHSPALALGRQGLAGLLGRLLHAG